MPSALRRAVTSAGLLLAVTACRSVGTPSADAPSPATVQASGPLLRRDELLVIGHRGAAYYAPEHTTASYDLALRLGADFIEQDLQFTADGQLVVMHDETLDRTTRGPADVCRGPARLRPLVALSACDAGTWFNAAFPARAKPEYSGLPLLSLPALFSRYRDTVHYYIETKVPETAPGMEDSLVALLGRAGLRTPAAVAAHRVILQSFSAASLRRLALLAPELPRVQLLEIPESEAPNFIARLDAIATYAQGIGPSRTTITPAVVREAHARCLAVHPWTVNDEAEMSRLIDAGVDGMFSDRADVLRRVSTGRHPGPMPASCRRS